MITCPDFSFSNAPATRQMTQDQVRGPTPSLFIQVLLRTIGIVFTRSWRIIGRGKMLIALGYARFSFFQRNSAPINVDPPSPMFQHVDRNRTNQGFSS